MNPEERLSCEDSSEGTLAACALACPMEWGGDMGVRVPAMAPHISTVLRDSLFRKGISLLN